MENDSKENDIKPDVIDLFTIESPPKSHFLKKSFQPVHRRFKRKIFDGMHEILVFNIY